MKNKYGKRIISLFLVVIMVIFIMPAGAIAASATGYIFPVIGGNAYVSSRYGSRWGSYHYGIDIATSGYNNTIVATRSGTVIGVYNQCQHVNSYPVQCAHYSTYGNLIKIRHDDGSVAYYGHLQYNSIKVSYGQYVKAGTAIANVGSSGYSSGPHLHFEIRRNPNASRSKTNCINVNTDSIGYQYLSTPITEEPPKPPVPNAPSTPVLNATDIAKGKSVTISWNSVSGATGYNLAVRGAEVKDIDVGNKTSYTYTLDKDSSYNFYIQAYNSTGSSSWSNYTTCTAHEPVTVKFVDYDGKLLKTQIVNYGESATAPVSPERKGYSFQGWDDSYYNVTTDKTIKAIYKINTYTVNFFDKKGELLKTEKVNYGEDATPPVDTNIPTGYNFHGWNSENYKNVYTDASNKTININGIYSWFNEDLPVVCTITSASRQPDGYYVYFNLTNYDKAITRGRAVVCLKTASGKLVDTTESAAFSIPKDGTKTGMEVFIPCDDAATKIEVIIVDSYSSGVPISEKVSSNIDQGLMWSQWSTEKPDATNSDLEVESRTEYRYRDKETSTGATKTKDGWIYAGTRNENYQGQTGYIDNQLPTYDNESGRRTQIGSRSVAVWDKEYKYCYLHIYKPNNGNHTWCPTWHGNESQGYQEHAIWLNYQLTSWGNSTCISSIAKYGWYDCPWGCGANQYWFRYSPSDRYDDVITGYKPQWNYETYSYTYNFYRWKNWSDWSTNEVAATSNKEVETRTVYRYKSTSAGIENDEGIERTVNGTLDSSFAGKQITLYVYGYTGASDYTNEYIGQSVVAADGSYSFTFKLREEPTAKTGDFTVAIGIEGTTNTTIIDTIEAPKPTYKVNFYDWYGTIIDTQFVTKGENAVLPANPSKEGYDFIGWDKSTTNITSDTDIFADFEKKEFTVVFVDWANQVLKTEKFNYGDVLITPDFSDIEGYTCSGWDEVNAGNTVVTSNMVVSAKYEINTYDVTFYDFDGNVIETQKVEYGSSAEAPEMLENGSDGQIFAGWFDPEVYQNVNKDVAVYPAYYFDESVDVPTANYESGEYDSKISLTLTSDDKNAVIFYYLNDDEATEKIYTDPITVDKTCSVTYYATSLGKNDSERNTNYYCINSSDLPSEWMLYSELPSNVIDNLEDFNLESKTGYRYKDTQSVSNSHELSELSDSGWELADVSYSDYTAWQDEEIKNDSSKIGFEIDTRDVEDVTVTRYQYSHYKYTDSKGVIQYSPSEVDGYDCEYETVILDSRLSIAGFLEDNTSYYTYNEQTWFTQTKVNGIKTQYRSRYQIAECYKWTTWNVESPADDESREIKTDTVYRYSNKNYHIVTLWSGFTDTPSSTFVEEGAVYDSTTSKLYGYNFDGLYLDEGLTKKFDLTKPITESLILYAKYVPKTYTVVFQMQDGTELDTQTVEYMDGATAPSTDVVPGYVFGGWDKDFNCITEDTVITGKYFKESEYARISLDKSSANMFQGNSMTLTPTITPTNLTDEVIEWSSSDPGVVSVDETGKVTAISAGVATVTAKVIRTKETATCEITVEKDKENYIVLKTDSLLNHDDLGYLRRVALKSSVEAISKEFENENLKFFDIKGVELTSSSYVGTGTQVKLLVDDDVSDVETFVVTGDMTGDGIINNRDVAMLNKKLVGKVETEECQMLATDVNGDGFINNRDAAMIARYLVGKDTF